ncbi:MAG: NAD(P)H-dependent glycerol-3-phosphate dehydrogenase [Candidatus Omnitrophota bacterium]
MNDKITIIGAGSWGTTLAVILAKKGLSVELHSVFPEHNRQMAKQRRNNLFLKGTLFPKNLTVNPSLKQSLNNEIIVVAIPVKFLRRVLRTMKKCDVFFKNKILVSVSKGIEAKSLKRPSQIIEEELGKVTVAVLSGPTIAKEVLEGIPTVCVIVSKKEAIAERLQKIFNSCEFRVYCHSNVVGVEFGGALKNIIAIACGISDGLGFGVNTKAALVTRGLAEMTKMGIKLGAVSEIFWGISGLGDLVTTCFSFHSRNRSLGEKIGKGRKLRQVIENMEMVAEGVETVKSVYQLSKKLKVDMPITKEVYLILYKNKSPKRAVQDLMKRPLKPETIR